MALYVSLTLLAAPVAIRATTSAARCRRRRSSGAARRASALAHWLAFDLASRLYRTEGLDRSEDPDRLRKLGGPVQVAAALAVAGLASIPTLVAPDDVASDVAICVLAFILASAGFAVGRRDGQGVPRSLVGGAIVLLAAGLVVAVKIAIGH